MNSTKKMISAMFAAAALGFAAPASAQYYDDRGYYDYGTSDLYDYEPDYDNYAYGDTYYDDWGTGWGWGNDYNTGYNPYGYGSDVFEDKWDTGLWDMGEYDAEDYPTAYRRDLRQHARGNFDPQYGYRSSQLGWDDIDDDVVGDYYGYGNNYGMYEPAWGYDDEMGYDYGWGDSWYTDDYGYDNDGWWDWW